MSECNCPVKNGKTQCRSVQGVICKKARRQQQSAAAVERQREEAWLAPSKPDPLTEVIQILADFIELMLDDKPNIPEGKKLLESWRDHLNAVRS